MKLSRRNVLKITGFGIVATALLPRVAFASRNSLRSLRTGAQPGNKTRLVIETSARPSYSLSYPTNQLVVSLSNTTANTTLSPKLGDGTLVKTLAQVQNGDKLQIVANLRKPIDEIKKSAIMVLEPNGDSGYRLVLDFVAGAGAVPAKSATASSVASQYGTYEEVAEGLF